LNEKFVFSQSHEEEMTFVLSRFDKYFKSLNKSSIFVFAVFLEAIIGWGDYVTGPLVVLASFYVIPIFISCWYGGQKQGLFISSLSAGIRSYIFYIELPAGSPNWLMAFALAQEGLLYLFFFLFISQTRIQFIKFLEQKEDQNKTLSLLNSTIESTTDGILVVDKDGKTVFLVNEQFLKMWHVPQSLVQMIRETKNDRPLLSYVTTQLKDPFVFFEKVRELYNHPGEESFDTLELSDDRIFERYSKPQMLEGNYHGRVWSFRDVTEKRKTEAELLKSMKLESIGLLAGGIAHDFNNFLTAILGNVSLAKMELDPNLSSYRYLSETEKATLRAKDLANQLLTFAKGGAPQKKLTSIVQVLQDNTMFALRGSNLNPKFHFPDNLWTVEIDPGQIAQVVHNLVINAKQAMQEGGEIVIRVENVLMDKQHASKLFINPGPFVLVCFKDNGKGIPENLINKIFDPFFTTKENGSGLGLFSTYSIVRNHYGTITVESRVGMGTSFFVYLPAVIDQKVKDDTKGDAILFGSGRILLMDDDELVRDMAKAMIQTLGYEVKLATRGEEALEIYRKAKEMNLPFQAVILDLTIPGGKGGKQTIQELLAYDRNVRAIVSSGYSNDPVLANYQEFGFKGCVAKPYRIQDLSKTLNDIIKSELPQSKSGGSEP
jgi:signal transduction histidine kinase/ActR/RegA family two-component response regulator